MVDRVNYPTGKMEALSRNIDKYLDVKTDAVLDIKTDMDSVKTMTHDLKSDIDRINSVLLKIDPDAVEQVYMDRLRTHGDAMLSRLGIPNPKRPAEVVDSAPIEVHRSSSTEQPRKSKRPRSHGDICQEIVDHGTAVTGAVGSAREFGIAAVIGFR